jgi:hypothetical protein
MESGTDSLECAQDLEKLGEGELKDVEINFYSNASPNDDL